MSWVGGGEGQAEGLDAVRRAYERSGSGQKRADAGTDYVFALIGAGQLERAEEILEQDKSIFYELGGEYPARLVRSNLALGLARLEPYQTNLYAGRAIAEVGAPPPALAAELELLHAQAALTTGQWGLGQRELAAARELATEAGASDTITRIDDLARRFSLRIEAP